LSLMDLHFSTSSNGIKRSSWTDRCKDTHSQFSLEEKWRVFRCSLRFLIMNGGRWREGRKEKEEEYVERKVGEERK